jgi:hypothetical protein
MKFFSRPGIILIAALICFIPGAYIGDVVADRIYPDRHLKGHDPESAQWVVYGCGMAGALAGLVVAVMVTKNKTSRANL